MKKREWMVLLTAALAAGAFGSTNVFAEEDLSSQEPYTFSLDFPAAQPEHLINAVSCLAGTSSPPVKATMAAMSSSLHAGHRFAGPPSAMAAAHSSQVANPHPPRPVQSVPGSSFRTSFARLFGCIHIHILQ